MEKIKARDLKRGDRFIMVGEPVKVLNMWFYGNRVQLEIEWSDKSTCQVTKKCVQTVDKLD